MRSVIDVETSRRLGQRGHSPEPMLATLGPPPSRGDWATEIKYDGQRGICLVEDVVTIFTRNGADVSSLGVILSPTRLSLVSAFLAYE